MTEDILEQIVNCYYFREQSTFTKHNVKYRPDIEFISGDDKNKYSVHSDIDVISFNTINNEVNVVNCKSWQGGFDIGKQFENLSKIENHSKIISGRQAWKSFREMTNEIWAKAFRDKILLETGKKEFNYIIAVTKLKNDTKKNLDDFCECKLFLKNLSGVDEDSPVKIKFLTLKEIIDTIQKPIKDKALKPIKKTAIESTEIGRLLQLIKAAGLIIEKEVIDKKIKAQKKVTTVTSF